jgi:hypothetical protein
MGLFASAATRRLQETTEPVGSGRVGEPPGPVASTLPVRPLGLRRSVDDCSPLAVRPEHVDPAVRPLVLKATRLRGDVTPGRRDDHPMHLGSYYGPGGAGYRDWDDQ